MPDPPSEPVLEDPSEPEDEPEPLFVSKEALRPPKSASESEGEDHRPKYCYIQGVGYIKIWVSQDQPKSGLWRSTAIFLSTFESPFQFTSEGIFF